MGSSKAAAMAAKQLLLSHPQELTHPKLQAQHPRKQTIKDTIRRVGYAHAETINQKLNTKNYIPPKAQTKTNQAERSETNTKTTLIS